MAGDTETHRRRFRPGPIIGLLVAAGVAAGAFFYREQLMALFSDEEPTLYSPVSNDDAVLIRIQVSPPEARLLVDGDPPVSNPLRLRRGSKVRQISAFAEGYTPAYQDVTPDENKIIQLRLTKAGSKTAR